IADGRPIGVVGFGEALGDLDDVAAGQAFVALGEARVVDTLVTEGGARIPELPRRGVVGAATEAVAALRTLQAADPPAEAGERALVGDGPVLIEVDAGFAQIEGDPVARRVRRGLGFVGRNGGPSKGDEGARVLAGLAARRAEVGAEQAGELAFLPGDLVTAPERPVAP